MGVDQALQQFFSPRINDGKTHAPNRAAHQIHSKQTGNEEIDVARAWFTQKIVAGSNRIYASGGFLDGAICQHTRGAAFGVCIVVAIDDGAVGIRHGQQGYFAGAQSFFGGLQIELLHGEKFFSLQRLRQDGIDRGDLQNLRGTITERDAQASGKKDWEREDPEERLWLAERFEEAHDGQLHQRMFGKRFAARSLPLRGSRTDIWNSGRFTHVVCSFIAEVASCQRDEHIL